jgi:predicted small metal-binding protein
MFEVFCRDLGFAECDFTAFAPSLRKLEYKMLEHARDEHPQLIAGITEEQHEALMKKIAEAAHETAVH